MTVVLVSPDYLSHYRPLSVVGQAAQQAGERVVVATGPSLRSQVDTDGFEWRQLRLGPASNPGLVAVEDPSISEFLAATHRGPVDTIAFQARKREYDLLWEPRRVADDLRRLLDDLAPEHLVVDHVSFTSTLAAHGADHPFVTLVPGHPTQLPVGAERYGLPPRWPIELRPDANDLAELELLLDRVTRAFTRRWNEALHSIRPEAAPVDDAYRVRGRRVLYNAVAALQDPNRLATDALGDDRFIGPLVASGYAPSNSEGGAWGLEGRRPRVYVAFGTFLANRADVLARVAAGLRRVGARSAIAIGPNRPEQLGPIPDDWIVEPRLPQVELLDSADIAITHGGNNSVQEALAAGCRQIVLPFSTDQFANAADLEQRAGSAVLAPNGLAPAAIADAVEELLDRPSPEPVHPSSPTEIAAALLG